MRHDVALRHEVPPSLLLLAATEWLDLPAGPPADACSPNRVLPGKSSVLPGHEPDFFQDH